MKHFLVVAWLAPGLAAQSLLWELAAPAGVRHYGHAVEALPDLDGDGVPDLALSAYSLRVELRSGRDGALLALHEDDSAGYGHVLARAGDVDGDGVQDVAVGSPGAIASFAPGCYEGCLVPTPGRVEVLSGRDAGVLLALGEPGGVDDEFGFALAALGDVDGDGHDDLAVGAPAHQYAAAQPGAEPTGRVWAFSGADGTPLWMTSGAAPRAAFGVALVALPDLDGDGIPELAVGASGAFAPFGAGAPPPPRVEILSGASGVRLRILEAPAWPGSSQPIDGFGARLAVVPGSDGMPGLLVGHGPPFGPMLGAVLVGLPAGELLAVLPSLGPWQAGQAERIAAGDIDGDGQAELLLGHGRSAELALCAADGRWLNALGSYLDPTFPNSVDTDAVAACGVVTGDLDGDGLADLLMGESGSGGDAWSYGRVRAFRGGVLPWTDLDHASGPGRYPPLLFPAVTRTPTSAFSPDATLRLRLAVPYGSGTPPGSMPGRLVIGFEAALAPVPGGVLVPSADLVLPITIPWLPPWKEVLDIQLPPALPSGLVFHVQAVVGEAGSGLAYSNAWRCELP